jgi:hypothetical protein
VAFCCGILSMCSIGMASTLKPKSSGSKASRHTSLQFYLDNLISLAYDIIHRLYPFPSWLFGGNMKTASIE